MTEDSDEDNPASVSAAFIDRITASLRRLGTTVEVAPEEAAHHPAGTGGAVSLAAIADSAETGSATPETESSIIQCPVCLDSLNEIKSRGKISELFQWWNSVLIFYKCTYWAHFPYLTLLSTHLCTYFSSFVNFYQF